MAEILRFFDEIGEPWGISAREFCGVLSGIGGDVDLYVNSPGGSIADAMTIRSALRRHPGQVRVTVTGLAASAASVLVMGADPGQLAVEPGSLMMIHEAWSEAAGSASDLRRTAAALDKASDAIAGIYAERTGTDAGHWLELMRAETWFSAEESVTCGLADSVASAAGEFSAAALADLRAAFRI